MRERPFGIILLAAALLAAGVAGIVAFWAAFPRTSDTSPLAAGFLLVWSCTYVASALLTWRRSRLAAPAFLAAMGLLLAPLTFLFPGDAVSRLPSFAVVFLAGFLGYRYLSRTYESAA
jgi:hypothetical protein